MYKISMHVRLTGISLRRFSGAAHLDFLLLDKNSAMLALFLFKIRPCMWIFQLKSVFFPNVFLPSLCFSFKNSFLIFVLILGVLFPSLLFYFHFTFSFSFLSLPIQFYETIFWKSLCVTNLNLWMILFFRCTNTLCCGKIVL